jgi:hypothetical protein
MTERKRSSAVDLESALLDPGAVFATPEDVVTCEGLSRQHKVDILQRWEYDASEVSVAVEEGMAGNNSDLVHRVLLALSRLTDAVDVEHVGPSKQHGIPD